MIEDFDAKLQKYADLTVKIGLNIQPGQRLHINTPLEATALVRAVAISAYKAGARLVDTFWADEQLTLIRYQYAPRDSFDEYPDYLVSGPYEFAERGDAILSVAGRDPDLLAGQDPELTAIAQKTAATRRKDLNQILGRNGAPWSIVSAPTQKWAAKIFPDESPERQIERLWETIFFTCRIDRPDPVGAWRNHIRDLSARSDYLNNKQYAALKYSGPGTDLMLGLAHNHRWKSAEATTPEGIVFVPNMPTEEVFTLPHRDRVDGVVSSSKPLNYGGTLIDNFQLIFKDGRAVDVKAAKGEATLRKLLDTDEGARHLGEVALVPHRSPIAQSGLLFYNTLFDENAASHLALGFGFPFNLLGDDVSDEDFAEAGGNTSLTHVDFMIGNGEMNVDGVRQDGEIEPVMRNGEWAFDV